MLDLSHTIAPKSDQLNSDDLIAGSITIKVSDIKATDSPDQPVTISYEGDDGRPYKPCKSMRRVLIQAWGSNGKEWIGKSMTLYRDPDVKFGGQSVGGIRISHLSDIDRDMNFMLTVTRAKRAAYSVKRLNTEKKKKTEAPEFESSFENIVASIRSGKSSIEKIKSWYSDRGAELTEDQINRILSAVKLTEEKNEDEEVDVF